VRAASNPSSTSDPAARGSRQKRLYERESLSFVGSGRWIEADARVLYIPVQLDPVLRTRQWSRRPAGMPRRRTSASDDEEFRSSPDIPICRPQARWSRVVDDQRDLLPVEDAQVEVVVERFSTASGERGMPPGNSSCRGSCRSPPGRCGNRPGGRGSEADPASAIIGQATIAPLNRTCSRTRPGEETGSSRSRRGTRFADVAVQDEDGECAREVLLRELLGPGRRPSSWSPLWAWHRSSPAPRVAPRIGFAVIRRNRGPARPGSHPARPRGNRRIASTSGPPPRFAPRRA